VLGDRYDRLWVLGAITLSPQRKRLDLRFSVWHENICTRHVVRFLKQLRQELKQPIKVVLDRLPTEPLKLTSHAKSACFVLLEPG
jgi:hypothetical protein